MAVSLVDAEKLSSHSRFKAQGSAAYYYPIAERVRLKADRGNLGKMTHSQTAPDTDAGAGMADQMMILFRDPDIEETKNRASFRGEFDDTFKAEYEEIEKAYEEAVRAEMILQEQGTTHEGQGDVTMGEVEDGEDAEVDAERPARRERDDDANTPTPPPQTEGMNGGAGHEDLDEDDEMQDG
jgi:hypothetical protein